MNRILKQFKIYLQAQDRSEHTVKAYCHDVTAFLDWLAKKTRREIPPVEVTSFDVKKYRDHLEATDHKPAGVNRRLAALRVFFAWAMKKGLASSNPAAEIKGVEQKRPSPKALSEQEVYRLQRTAAAQRQVAEAKTESITPTVIAARCDEALLALLLYTGLRVSEAAALRVEDVVLNERSSKVIVRAGKGRKYREVPMHKEARKAVSVYLEARPDDGRGDPGGRPLFVGQRGPLGTRGIQLRLAAIGKAAEVKVTPHVLRHTFGTRLLREAKADLVTVSALMGHSSVATTAIYTQPSEDDLAEAVDKL